MPVVRIAADAGLHGHDLGLHDHPGVDLPQAHADQAEHADPGVGHVGLKPQLAVADGHDQHDQHEDDANDDPDEHPGDDSVELVLGEKGREEAGEKGV